MTHPETLEIELLRTGEADEAVRRHVDGCAECQAVLAELRGLGESARQIPSSRAIPEDIDRRILWQARKRAFRIRRGPRTWRAPTWRVAAAAVAVLGLVATWRAIERPSSRSKREAVTMLDALRVARAVDAGTAEARWDWTGDGAVDRRDVDAIALRAVALEVRR